MVRIGRYLVVFVMVGVLSSGVGGQASQETVVELGDITDVERPQFPRGEVAAVGDTVTYTFTLSAPRTVGLGLRGQEHDADLVVVDAGGAVVGRSATAGTANEWLKVALGPGGYRAQVVAQAAGANAYVFRYGVGAVADDYGADLNTSGTLLVGESTTGGVDYVGDEDWFFIDLEAARTYTLSVAGATSAPVVVGVYDAVGTEVTAGLTGLESAAATFTPATTGLYYVAVAATDIETGAYTLTVTDTTPVSEAGSDADAEAAEAEGAPVETRSSPPTPLWVGEMTVGVTTDTQPAYRGYSRWARLGSLTAVPSTPARPPLLALVQHAGGVYLALSRALESDFTLRVGTQPFRASASAIPTMAGGGRYWWAHAGPQWADGSVLAVSLTPVAGEPALGPRSLAPPTVLFSQVPTRHDGTAAFAAGVRFSEAVALDAAGLEAGVVTVSGGTLTSVHAGATPRQWVVNVQPTGAEDVQVTVAGGPPCGQVGAVCTADGRPLYNSARVTVAGPAAAVALAELTLDGVPLTPGFTPEQTLYTGPVGASVTQVTVAAVAREATSSVALSPADADSSVVGHQVALVAGGETAVTVTVTAADGASRQYWVVLSPPAGSPGAGAPQLSGFGLVGVPALGFDPAVARYAVAAPAGVTQVTVIFSRQETGAVVEVLTVRGDDTTLRVESTDADPATAGHQVALAGAGDTLVLVRVTSADGQRQQCYVVLVHGVATPTEQAQPKHVGGPGGKAGPAVSLGHTGRALVEGQALRDTPAGPTLSALSLAGVSLSPAFASTTTDYTATVGAAVAQVTVAATATAATAAVVVTPADADPDTAGHQVALSAGVPGGTATETVIAVLVRAADATLNAYLITVSRAAPASDDTTLSALSLDGVTLVPAFQTATHAYTATIDRAATEFTVSATATDSGATVEITPADADTNTSGHQIAFASGTDAVTVTVTVTAADDSTATYTIAAVRAPATDDASLSALSVDGAVLTPAFAPGTAAYTATVPHSTAQITLDLVTTHSSAQVTIVPVDADPVADGYQIPLTAVEGGASSVTTIAIVVTAADTTTRQTYALTVTREAPLWTLDLPEGCTLEPLFDTQDGTQRSRWLRPCRSIYSYPRDWGGAYVTGLARYFRMDLLSDGPVELTVRATTTHHILIRDADGIPVAHTMFDRGAHECHQPCVPYGPPMRAELKAGAYMIEVVQHFSVDLRQRPFTLTVDGDVSLHPAPRLSDLTLNGTSISGFDAEEFDYPMDAPAAVVTVGAVASAPSSAADVRIFPDDADPNTAGHQVTVASADVTELMVRVSDPDGFLTKEYTVTFFGQPDEALPLTAKFLRVRLGHGGDYDLFSMRVAFSKPITDSETVLEQARSSSSLNDNVVVRRLGGDDHIDLYSIDNIRPWRYQSLRIVLPQTTDCSATDAICTDDGDMLSNRAEARVPFKFLGWAEPDVLTLPQSDDYTADTSTTGTVAVDGTATGWLHAAGDRDWFEVELEVGTTYRMDATGDGAGVVLAYALTRSRSSREYGGTLHNPALVVYDSAGVRVPGASDNNSGEGLNARLEFTPATAGTYYLEIKDPGGIGTYTLAVTEIPQSDDYAADTSTTGTVAVDGTATGWLHTDGDRDWFGVELEAGTTYRIDARGDVAWDYGGTLYNPALVVYHPSGVQVSGASDDDSGAWRNARLEFTPATAGTYYLEIKDPGGIGTYTLAVTEIPQSDDYAADTSTTGTVAVDGTATGWLHTDGDRDWFGVELEAGTTYRLDATGDVAWDYGGTLPNPALVVYHPSGVQVSGASDDNSGEGLNARLEFTPAAAGTYYLEIKDPGGIGTYTLAVTEVE